ncbi:MAG: putative PEP-binding protein, partial [Nitrososphaerales archaeon]
ICSTLEQHYREPQDVEFTVEHKKLYMLQTRAAKMNAAAMVKSSVDMVRESLVSKERALLRVKPEQLEQILHKRVDPKAKIKAVATGIAASPGAATGKAVFDTKKAEEMGEKGEQIILVRDETKPEDVPAFFVSNGILTSRGGKTSHAAVVARGMGKPCIVGCSEINIDYSANSFRAGSVTVREGDLITIDGSVGRVYVGDVPTIDPEFTEEFQQMMRWADELKSLGVRANADTPEGASVARKFGAKGIGLCRTERMFNGHDSLPVFIDMIMARTEEERRKALKKLMPLQKSDFKKILEVMEGYPVTIRLLDPPLHEFLPGTDDLLRTFYGAKGTDAKSSEEQENLLNRARELAEVNPMMGHRGVRIGITFPEIYETQIRAIFEATAELLAQGVKAEPQIMVPQVGSAEELMRIRRIYDSVRREVEAKYKRELHVKFGTMIEVVRACMTADSIAEVAEFFSFGTNDLTQAVFSFSREDVEGKFLPFYLENGVMAVNPFQSLDLKGVGSVMSTAVELGRCSRRDLEIGICGEHGGDPKSIEFCNKIGLNYVSASPHRIPIALLAAAQTVIKQKQDT